MNLGDAPLNTAPAGAPGYAPAPQAEINAAIAAEEAPTPEERAIANPLTNVISALLAGRRRLLQQPGPEHPAPQQPAAGGGLIPNAVHGNQLCTEYGAGLQWSLLLSAAGKLTQVCSVAAVCWC